MTQAAILASVLAVAIAASGCVFRPSAGLSARPGDFVELVVGAWQGDRLVWGSIPPGTPPEAELQDGPAGWYVMAAAAGGEPPAELPAEPEPLPVGLVATLVGASVGDSVAATLPPALGFGERREANVVDVPLDDAVPRLLEASSADVPWARAFGDRGPLDAYGSAEPFPAEAVERRNETWLVALEPPASWNGTVRLAHPDVCAPGRCLFRSMLSGWNATHLRLRHEPRLGDSVVAHGVTAQVAALDDHEVTIDYNHPLAGRTLDVRALVLRIVPPSGSDAWRAPLFDALTLDGGRFRLADHLDRPVLVEFFASWCPSCVVNHRRHIPELAERWGDDLVVVSVNVDPFEGSSGVRSFVREHGVAWPVVVDGAAIATEYRVGTLSTDVLVAPGGAVDHVGTGELDVREVDRRIGLLLGGRS